LIELPRASGEEPTQRGAAFRSLIALTSQFAEYRPALVMLVDRRGDPGAGLGQGRLVGVPDTRPPAPKTVPPWVIVHAPPVAQLFDSLKPGSTGLTLTLSVPAPVERPVRLRNVLGLLRGSDPALKETYVLITAHYDHLAPRPVGGGDRIYNGANDDGSGTVAVIELASALAALPERPRRSVLFMTFFGEERGLLGSRHYSRNPVFPIEQTVAHLNLEQIGRTDSSEGPQIGRASLTGFDYSDVGTTLRTAGELTGIEIYKHERNSDTYFARSDNRAFADLGVPAHTLSVAFLYPDYHSVGDHWEKIDYGNMARVTRAVGLGLLMIANEAREPRWNEAQPRAARYLKAWQERRRG
jgi:hypothetical protein